NAFPVSRTYTRKAKVGKKRKPGLGRAPRAKPSPRAKSRLLMQSAKQPDHQNDRKGDADQPQEKSSTHCSISNALTFRSLAGKRRNHKMVPRDRSAYSRNNHERPALSVSPT